MAEHGVTLRQVHQYQPDMHQIELVFGQGISDNVVPANFQIGPL